MFDHDTIVAAAHKMSSGYRAKRDTGVGEPEAALRGPLESFVDAVTADSAMSVVMSDEVRLGEAGVRPDYGVHVDGQLVGYLEVKEPGKGVNTSTYRGHDKTQWQKLRDLPNVLYTDGDSWALYRFGQRPLEIEQFDGSIGNGDHAPADLDAWTTLLESFLTWAPTPPKTVRQLADTSARLCRLLKAEVEVALKTSEDLRRLGDEWRQMLFPDADDSRFADQYAQTVTFALLLARAEDIDLKDRAFSSVADELKAGHGLLGVALRVFESRGVV